MTDVFSWGDSSPEDPFDDDSWMSEPESICNNWRGWKKTTPPNSSNATNGFSSMASTSSGHQNRYHHHLHLPASSSGMSRQDRASTTDEIRRSLNLPPVSYINTTTAATNTITNNRTGVDGSSPSSSSNINNNHYNFDPSASSSSYSAAAVFAASGSNPSQSENFNTDYNGISGNDTQMSCCGGGVPTLTELAARSVAYHISFEVVERVCSPVPEQLQLRIAYWSFPDNEEDIRLYSCLANGSADEFQKGETLYRCRSIQSPLQIGFHLSATVVSASTKTCTVAVTFDRCRITSCSCTCASPSSWCSHVVAVCLHRIYQPNSVRLRAPVSESLTRLSRDQLQKFAQYLISESPQQILPTAQRLLDDLLLNDNSDINKVRGAPDPTAGAPANEQTKWCLDEFQLHGNIRKIVIKLCIPSPMVYSDVNYLSSAAPPAAAEWSSLLRPLRGREPEGLWNLLSIVREMLRRHDRNAIPLLRILTEELLSCDQILIWWFTTNVSLHRGFPPYSFSHHVGSNGGNNGGGSSSNNRSMHSNIYASQHACCSLCDEIVVLWRLVTLNPAHSYSDTQTLYDQLKEYHLKTLSAIHRFKPSSAIGYSHLQNFRSSTVNTASVTNTNNITNSNGKSCDLAIFSGFKPAMISCLVNWDNYPIPGVTNQKKSHRYYEPSLHDQLNSVNHAITSTAISLGLDPMISSWPTAAKSSSSSVYQQQRKRQQNCQTQSDQFSDTNSSVGNNNKNVRESRRKKSDASISNYQKDNCESEDSGNQEFWERFSVASSDDDDKNANSKSNENEPGPSGLQRHSSSDQQPEDSSQNVQQNDDGQGHISNEDYQIYIYNANLDNQVKKDKTDNCGDSANRQVNQAEGSSEIQSQNSHDYQWDPILLQATMVKSIEDPFEILFARAEALYAHGYVEESCRLSICLAEELLGNPPDLQMDLNSQNINNLTGEQATTSNNQTGRNHTKRINRVRFNPALHQVSLLTSATLSKAAFLCQVLSENEDSHLLAFQVGLFGLELIRPPASTKALEVKLAHQEQELVNLLKKIPLCPQALYVLREKAEQLRDGRLTTRGEALLPLSLASYLFEAFLLSNQIVPPQYRLQSDERLLFDAAVAAIGLKAKVSEAEHPLLCEGTRRQRGDLALQLLVHYKDNKQRLDLIMEKLLDQEIHPIFSSSKKQQQSNIYSSCSNQNLTKSTTPNVQQSTVTPKSQNEKTSESAVNDLNSPLCSNQEPSTSAKNSTPKQTNSIANNDQKSSGWNMIEEFQKFSVHANDSESINPKQNDSSTLDTTSSDNSPTVARRTLFHKQGKVNSGSDSSSSSGESSSPSGSSDSLSATSETKKSHHQEDSNSDQVINTSTPINATDAIASPVKFANSKSLLAPSAGPSAARHLMDASAGSPSILATPGSSTVPAPGSLLPTTYQLSATNSGYNPYQLSTGPTVNSSVGHGGLQPFKSLRYKGKRHYPVIPNQPSEASAHFMFELAKTLLAKAGGNNTTVLFTQPPSSQNCRAPHRLLHMCAFQIGLYALGLHNAVAPNWLSRTYSSHVSWITCQAMEIGHQAIEFLIDTWEGHLTPSEVASLADRASRSQEPLMVKAAAELALSCLPHAHALTPSEIQRALIQSKEQSTAMLERACLSVEQAAQGGGVYPEVLFDVARKWYQLYINEKVNEIESVQREMNSTSNDNESCADTDLQSSANAQATSSDSSALDSMSFINIIQQEFYDTQATANQQQGSFGPPTMDPNSQIAFASGHPIHHPMMDPSMAAYYQSPASILPGPNLYSPMRDMNQYIFYPSQQQRNQLYQQRPINNKNQQPKPMSHYYHHHRGPFPSPAIIFDPQRGYHFNGGQNPITYQTTLVGPGFNPQPPSQSNSNNSNVMRQQYYPQSAALLSSPVVPNINSSGSIPVSGANQGSTIGGSPLFTSNGSYFYPIANSAQPPNMPQMMGPANTTPYPFMAPFSPIRGFVPQNFVATQANLSRVDQSFRVIVMDQLAQYQPSSTSNGSSSHQSNGNGSNFNHHSHHHHHNFSQPKTQTILGPRQLAYMHAAYRVGMLAMETLARRVNDDRPQAKYARNPSYGEDVKWLLLIAKKLGAQYVQEFCLCTLSAVASPFVLYDIILEAAQSIFQNANNNTAYIHTIRSHILTPLIHKCQIMFTSGIYFQLMNIASSDYDEFISTLRTARAAFQMTPGGHLQFNDLLQKLKRTKSCKKELWQQITNAMQST